MIVCNVYLYVLQMYAGVAWLPKSYLPYSTLSANSVK